jgi:uncharacterized membrane protein
MTTQPPDAAEFNAAEIGAIVHLYRDDMYRSKIWRTRLDATTNGAGVTTGIACRSRSVPPTPPRCQSSWSRS